MTTTIGGSRTLTLPSPRVPGEGKYFARRARTRHQRRLAFIAVSLISVGFFAPFVWMLSTSLKTLDKTMEYPPRLIPDRIEMHSTLIPQNYWRVVTHDKMDFPLYTFNTLTVALLAVIGTVISSSLAAYGFARIRFKGRGALFAIMLST